MYWGFSEWPFSVGFLRLLALLASCVICDALFIVQLVRLHTCTVTSRMLPRFSLLRSVHFPEEGYTCLDHSVMNQKKTRAREGRFLWLLQRFCLLLRRESCGELTDHKRRGRHMEREAVCEWFFPWFAMQLSYGALPYGACLRFHRIEVVVTTFWWNLWILLASLVGLLCFCEFWWTLLSWRNLWILLAISLVCSAFANIGGVFEFWLDWHVLPHLRVLILISYEDPVQSFLVASYLILWFPCTVLFEYLAFPATAMSCCACLQRKKKGEWMIIPCRAVAPATVTALSICMCCLVWVTCRLVRAAFTSSRLVITRRPVCAVANCEVIKGRKTMLKTKRNSSLVTLFWVSVSKDFWVNVYKPWSCGEIWARASTRNSIGTWFQKKWNQQKWIVCLLLAASNWFLFCAFGFVTVFIWC